ncbi:unnamed protein product [Victoria cruziana]
MCSSVVSMKPTEGHRKLFPSISSVCRAWELSDSRLFTAENGTAATLQEVELKSIVHGPWHRRPISTLSSSGDWTDERPISLTLLQFGDFFNVYFGVLGFPVFTFQH